MCVCECVFCPEWVAWLVGCSLLAARLRHHHHHQQQHQLQQQRAASISSIMISIAIIGQLLRSARLFVCFLFCARARKRYITLHYIHTYIHVPHTYRPPGWAAAKGCKKANPTAQQQQQHSNTTKKQRKTKTAYLKHVVYGNAATGA